MWNKTYVTLNFKYNSSIKAFGLPKYVMELVCINLIPPKTSKLRANYMI